MAEELLETSRSGKESPAEVAPLTSSREALRLLQSFLGSFLEFDVALLSWWSKEQKEVHLLGLPSSDRGPLDLRRLPATSPPSFRLIDGSLVAVFKPDERNDVTQVATLVSDKEGPVRSGITVPVDSRQSRHVTLVLASQSDSLSDCRDVFANAELKQQLRDLVAGIDLGEELKRLAPEGRLSYESVFYRSGTPALIISAEGRVRAVNRAFESLSGYAEGDFSDGKTLFDIVPPRYQPELWRWLEEIPTAAGSHPLETVLLSRNGREHTVLASRSDLGEGGWLVLTLTDVTRYKQHEMALRDWVQRIEAINKITSAVSSSVDFEDLFATVCEHIREMIDFDVACLALLSDVDSGGRVRIRLCGKPETQQSSLSALQLARFLEAVDKRPSDVSSQAGEEVVYALLGERVQSYRILPLLLQGEVEGCFAIGSYYAGAFSTFHTAVLRGIAAQLSIAVHKTRMVQEMQRHLSNLNQLSRASATITGTLEIDSVLRQMVQAVESILAPKLVWVESLVREDLVPRAIGGEVATDEMLPAVTPTPPIERVLRGSEPVSFESSATDPALPDARRRLLVEAGVDQLLTFPIRPQGASPLLLWIGRDAQRPFTPSDLELTSTLVSHASAAIANAHLYDEVRKTKNYLQNVIESSIDAIVTVNRAGRITFVGKGGQETFGYAESEVVGQPVWKFWAGGERVARRLRRALSRKQGKVIDHHLEVYRSDGRRVPVSLSVSAIRNHKGRTVGYLGIAKDMTDQRRAEEEIRRKSEELENFVYLISHNLKAPIVSVQGFASLLVTEGHELEEDQRRHYLDRILRNVGHMQDMIHDLLEFSRIGHLEIRKEKVDLNKVMTSLADEMRLQLVQKGIELRFPDDLPVVDGDHQGIFAVFSNLLSNSIKYIGDGENPVIEVGWEDKGRFFAFWVRDNGMGIEPKYHDQIFDLFQRGGAGNDIEGTGVGLAIVKRIVENHGGAARLASEPGVGTTVYFTLPKA